MNPPPLPDLPPEKSAAHHAANWSLILAVLTFATCGAVGAMKSSGQATPAAVLAVIGLVALAMVVTGLALGIWALIGISKHGPGGLLGKGLGGIVLNGAILSLLLFGAVRGFNQGRQTRQYIQDIRASAQQLAADQKKNFNPKTGITNLDINRMDQIRTQLDQGAQNLSGDDALVARAMSSYLTRLKDASLIYQAAKDKMDQAHVLSLSTLENQGQIASRRELVQGFLAGNAGLMETISNSASGIRADLTQLGVSPEKIDGVIAGFQQKWSVRSPLLLAIRDCDHRMGEGMLGLLDVLNQNWGKWNYDASTKLVTFTDPDARVAYRQNLADIRAAGQQEVQFQSQMVSLPQ